MIAKPSVEFIYCNTLKIIQEGYIFIAKCTNLKWSLFLQLGGTSWTVQLGRRDSTTAGFEAANSEMPSPGMDLSDLISGFSNKGFTEKEMVALSGKT